MTNDKKGGGFDPHPEGTFAAVCCDVFRHEKENEGYGKPSRFPNDEGQYPIDNRKTLRSIVFSFITNEVLEINGEMKPRYVSKWVSDSWHEKSNCRKFVSGWMPEAGRLDTFNLDTLVGRAAMVQVEQYTKRSGYTGANVSNAMALPKGMVAPEIPDDFVRHDDREAATDRSGSDFDATDAGASGSNEMHF